MKIRLLILLAAAGCLADDLCFVQLTDTHFGPAEHNERTRQAVEAINALPFDVQFVAVTGDVMSDNIADEAILSEGLTILEQLKVPVHLVPGNHDIDKKNVAETLAIYTNRFGPLTSRETYCGVECVFIYTEPLARGFDVPGYDVLSTAGTLLDGCEDSPVILFHHAPSTSDFYKNKMHSGWPNAEGRSAWQALLQEKQVDAVIAGHFHRAELHWIGEISVHVAPAIANYWGRQASFRIYFFKDGHLSYRTQYIEGTK